MNPLIGDEHSCWTTSGPLVEPCGTVPVVVVLVTWLACLGIFVPLGPGNKKVMVAPTANVPESWSDVSAETGWGDKPVMTGVGGTRLTVVTACAPGFAAETACMAPEGTTLSQLNPKGVKSPFGVMFPVAPPKVSTLQLTAVLVVPVTLAIN